MTRREFFGGMIAAFVAWMLRGKKKQPDIDPEMLHPSNWYIFDEARPMKLYKYDVNNADFGIMR